MSSRKAQLGKSVRKSSVLVLVIAVTAIPLIADYKSMRTSFVDSAKSNGVLGWVLFLAVFAIAVVSLLTQHDWFTNRLKDEKEDHKAKLAALQAKLNDCEKESKLVQIGADAAAEELEGVVARLKDLEDSRWARADVELAEKILGELRDGAHLANAIRGHAVYPIRHRWSVVDELSMFSWRLFQDGGKLRDEALSELLVDLCASTDAFLDDLGNKSEAIVDGSVDDDGDSIYRILPASSTVWSSDPETAHRLRREFADRKRREVIEAGNVLERVHHLIYTMRVEYGLPT